ncbi:hypothetical protein QTP88_007616 [Uroleucon formosanum]
MLRKRSRNTFDLSNSSPDTSKINKLTSDSFSEISKDNLRLYDNLNTSTSSFVNNTENILENSNVTYQNCQKESSKTYENILKNLKINDTSNNIYEELNFNNQPENSETIENKLINHNNSTNIIDSSNTSEKPKFENENTAIIINNQKEDNLNFFKILSTPLNKQTQIMTDKMLMIKPYHFSGNEDVRKYFKQYEKVADVNGWKNEDKVRFSSVFVKGTAKNRRQGDTESIMSFVTEIENISRQLNKNMQEEDICIYILKALKETVLHAISLHDNSNLKELKKKLKKFELMQFRINNREPELSDYTDILNEHVSQLNQKTKEKGREIDELKRQSRSYNRETNYRRQQREYRDKSPYPERFNYRSRESSRNRQYGRDRSQSRERQFYNKIQNEANTNQDYERNPSHRYDSNNYEYRDNSRNRETNLNTVNGRKCMNYLSLLKSILR